MGKSDRNTSCQTGNGNDRIRNENTEAAREMRERYLVSPQKTALAITIANREREILKDIDYENGYSLYIGIPFCPSICLYCSFSSYPLKVWEKRTDEYVEALCREVRETALMMKEENWTPSILAAVPRLHCFHIRSVSSWIQWEKLLAMKDWQSLLWKPADRTVLHVKS